MSERKGETGNKGKGTQMKEERGRKKGVTWILEWKERRYKRCRSRMERIGKEGKGGELREERKGGKEYKEEKREERNVYSEGDGERIDGTK